MRQTELNCVLAQKAKQGDKAALEELWAVNQGLIRKIIHQYPTTKSVDADDLLQCAWFGLLEAVREFDPERGAFTTVLVWCVRQSCLAALGRRRKQIDEAVSLDTPLTDDADATRLVDMLEDETLVPLYDQLEDAELRQDVRNAVDRLPPKESAVLYSRYFCGMKLQEIAEQLSMTVDRVRYREGRALTALRRDKVLCRWCCPDGIPLGL